MMQHATQTWLLDNCPCPKCLHPRTRERTVILIDIDPGEPLHVEPSAYEHRVETRSTGLALELHSDLPNYAMPPDFQFLHAIANDAVGGDSTMADAFAVAEQLRSTNPAAFDVLSTWPVRFAFHDDVDDIRHSAPTIGLESNRVSIVRFNNWIRDLDVELASPAGRQFYDAYLAFWRLLREPANVERLRLRADEVLCFDNVRMLHGRTAFDPATGHRHLQGCYVDRDMVLSRLRKLALWTAR
jgi:gamma-butyrobetaine dioxygenase